MEGRGTSGRRTVGGNHSGCNGTQCCAPETTTDSDVQPRCETIRRSQAIANLRLEEPHAGNPLVRDCGGLGRVTAQGYPAKLTPWIPSGSGGPVCRGSLRAGESQAQLITGSVKYFALPHNGQVPLERSCARQMAFVVCCEDSHARSKASSAEWAAGVCRPRCSSRPG